MAEAEIPFSTDEAFDDLTDKDKTAELSGYICWIKPAHSVGDGKYRLLKFTLTNDRRKVHCCIWGQPLIDIYNNNITLNRKVHIDGVLCKSSRITIAMENEGYVPSDIVIQPFTMLSFFGIFEQAVPVPVEVVPTAVDFETIRQAEGLISIDGFIRMRFIAIPSRFQNASYGCGSITNGRSKLTVNITHFVLNDNLRKGVAVNVIGTIDNSNGILSVTCKDVNAISIREDVPDMSDVDLAQGGRTLKRPASVG